MKNLMFLLMLYTVCDLSAQPLWNGAAGLTFGISKVKTKSICAQKGGRAGNTNLNDRLTYHDIPIGTEMAESVICYFFDDKLFNIVFLFSPENETYEDYLKLFVKMESIIGTKYGKSRYSNKIYEGNYKANDGNDQMTLIRNGNLRLKESWMNLENLNEVQLGVGQVIVGLEQPYVYLSYSDGELTLKASIRDENINKIEF